MMTLHRKCGGGRTYGVDDAPVSAMEVKVGEAVKASQVQVEEGSSLKSGWPGVCRRLGVWACAR